MSGIVSGREEGVRNEDVCHYKCQMPQRKGRERKAHVDFSNKGVSGRKGGKVYRMTGMGVGVQWVGE